MSDVVIRAEGLGKKYLIGHETKASRENTLRDSLVNVANRMRRSASDLVNGRQLVVGDEVEEFWALKDVNFEIRRGEVVGIIGRNGAGKSTLLKVLSRITEPTEGRVTIDGRVASLLEVGTGFHPELSGRENVFLNGSILGMSRKEIQAKFDEIVEFAGVGKFVDTPVKRYSSGMKVRLGFSVAAHLEPEILIVDEVLAVGDAEFQKKCIGKMQDVAGAGRTVLFVSHNMPTIQALCPRCLLMERGLKSLDGPSSPIIAKYFANGEEKDLVLTDTVSRKGTGSVRFVAIETDRTPQTGQPLAISIRLSRPIEGSQARASLLFSDMNGQAVMLLSSELPRTADGLLGCDELEVRVPKLSLTSGRYSLTLFLEVDGTPADWIDHGTTINVESGDFYGTGKTLPNGWSASLQLIEHSWVGRQSSSSRSVL